MSISILPSISPPRLERRLLPERLARTVCEIDPSPGSPFAVAVVLEVLGYSDRRAQEGGWADVFALARDVFDRIEFLGTAVAPPIQPTDAQAARPEVPSPLMSVVAQQAVWLVMVVLMIAWGRSLWSADHVPSAIARVLAVGILGSLIVSGGFQYAITRRFIFHTAQRDLMQAQAFLHRALWTGGLVMSVGALAVGVGIWMIDPLDHLAPLVAAAYFLLHGNYRVAVVPLIALNDVVGIILSTGVGVGLLALTYTRLLHAGTDAAMAIVVAQLAGLTALWLGSLARTRSLLSGMPVGVVQGAELRMPRGSRGLPQARWLVLCLEAAPWFATGVGVTLLAMTFTRLFHTGTDAARAIIVAQLTGLIALWLGSLGWTRSPFSRGTELRMPRGSHGLPQARWLVLCLQAAPWFATGVGVTLLAMTFTRLLDAGTGAARAIVVAQVTGMIALWLGTVARSGSPLSEVAVGIAQGAELWMPQGSRGLPQARWLVVCLDAAPWFTTGVLYYLFLFGTRPIAWMLPPAERQVFESGVDLGILGIVPVAIAASWAMHRYYEGVREQLKSTTVLGVTELRSRAVARFTGTLLGCRWFGVATAVGLLAATAGAPWGGMSAPTFLVFRLTVVGLTATLPGFLFSFGLLTSLGALWDAGGVLMCGLILELGAGLSMAQGGTADWLALALVGSTAMLSELAIWRAKLMVRNIDRHYYAAF